MPRAVLGRQQAKTAVQLLSILTFPTSKCDSLFARYPPLLNITKLHKEVVVPSLKLTAATAGVCSLSWCQVGGMGPISVLHKSLQPDQWTDYVSVPEDYTAYFSPSYKESNEFCMGWERCPSFPGISGFCARSTTITAKYVSESEAATEEAMEGFQARVFQHEADHCLGLTFIHPISAGGKLKLDSHLENEAFEILVKEKIEKLKEGVNEFLTRMSEDAECRNLLSSINEEKRFQLALRGLSSKEIVKEFYEDFRDVMEDTREIETKFKF